jgi:EAL domain-containing protein (putative c-di-GMP-specific phosphodiesterase class I)
MTAMDIAEKVLQTIAAPFRLTNYEAITTASIGVALSSPHYKEAEDIIRDADTAMYRAKDNGKARYEIFNMAMHTRAVTLLRLETDLRRAIENEELCVYYQPIMSVATRQLHGFEALVRWHHPERGVVSPNDFIALAEETGLILPIGLNVLREACRQLRKWQQQSLDNRDLVMSVNLSGKQLAQPDLVERIKEVLHETQLEPRHLKLEVTESVVMENPEVAAVTLARLRGLGLLLSIDDFGTGYSSLSYLNRFPLDILKIDRSFISTMNKSDENLQIVKTIVTLAGNLGMQVIAEGVETEEQLNQLRLLKCQYAQGFLFSKPIPAAQADLFILNRTSVSSPVLQISDLEPVELTM